MTVGPIAAQTPSFVVKLRHGILLWPFVLGFSSLQRALAIGELTTKASIATHGVCDWELMMVATAPQHQKQGASVICGPVYCWQRCTRVV